MPACPDALGRTSAAEQALELEAQPERAEQQDASRHTGRFDTCGVATQTNAKSLVLELELRQPVITQKRDQLAKLLHVHGRCRT